MESGKISLTTVQVGQYLKVQPVSVVRWIKEKKLKTFKTDGGEKRILLKNVYAFVKKHGFPVNGRIPKPTKELVKR